MSRSLPSHRTTRAVIVWDFNDRKRSITLGELDLTIARWRNQIVAWPRKHTSNGPSQAIDSLVRQAETYPSTDSGHAEFGPLPHPLTALRR